ncbi:MAG: hypothetical protein ACYTKD_01340 [Planctomycetota bacterium]|jgi:topoisomerase IA-like protein
MPEETRDEGGAGFFGRVWARFGEVARTLGIVHEHDVNEALEHQETTTPRKKLGEILVEKGKMTDDHVEAVLREQKSAVEAEAAALAAEKPAPKAPPAKKPAAKKAKKAKKKAGKRAAKKIVKKTAAKMKAKKKAKKKAGKKGKKAKG